MGSIVNSTRDNKLDEDFLSGNNPANLFTFDAYLKTVYYYNAFMKPPVVSLGVSANIVNSLVFRRQGLGDRMNLCLFILALVDMSYLAYSAIFTLVICLKIQEPAAGGEIYVKTYYYAIGVDYGLREASACISVVVAVERCVCVVFPLRANSLMTTRTMGILLVAIVIGMQLAFVATPFKRYVYPVYDNSTGGIRWTGGTSVSWQKTEALLLYDKLEDTLTMVVFPFLAVITVTGVTIVTVFKLRAAMSWREKTSFIRNHAHAQQVALTNILVLVSSVFVVCKVPWVALTLARIFYPEFSPFGAQCNMFRVVELVAHYFLYCHSCVNFFIYYSRSSRFRLQLRAVGC